MSDNNGVSEYYTDSSTKQMSDKHREAIRKVRTALVQDLDVSDIMDHMIESGIINDHKRDVIFSKGPRKERVRTFLDILVRSGSNALNVFMDSLKESYFHLFDTLQKQLTDDEHTNNTYVEYTNIENYQGFDYLPLKKQDENGMYSDAYGGMSDSDGYILGVAQKVSDDVCYRDSPTLTMVCRKTCNARIISHFPNALMSTLPIENYFERPLPQIPTKTDDYTQENDGRNDINCPSQEETVTVAQGEFLFLEELESKRIQSSDRPNSLQVRIWDKFGRLLHLPYCALKMYGDPFGEPWFYPVPFSSLQADLILRSYKKSGVFLVYRPVGASLLLHSHRNDNVVFNLSMVTSQGSVHTVIHYHIKGVPGGEVTMFGRLTFSCIQDLVLYYKVNRGDLPCRLRHPPIDVDRCILPGDHYDMKWHIEENSLKWHDNDSISAMEGQFGKVVKASKDNIAVAVKFQSLNQKVDPWSLEIFFEEAQIMSRMDHRNVVQLQGYSLTKVPFIVMEYISGGSLSQALKNNEVDQDFPSIVNLFGQILQALQYLESLMFVIHGDVAARNILVGVDWCLKLADFGLARIVTEDGYVTEENARIPVKHSAPEVLKRGRLSTKSDVWAAGVVLWEMLSDGHVKPYEKYSTARLIQFLETGGRLLCPKDHPKLLKTFYMTITKLCWKLNENSRPSAGELLDVVHAHPKELLDDVESETEQPLNVSVFPTPKKKGSFLKKIKWKGSSKLYSTHT